MPDHEFTSDINAAGAVAVGTTLAVDGVATVGDGSTTATVNIDGAAGTVRSISFKTDGSSRLKLGIDTTAEGGSNAGSNMTLWRYSDAGAYIDAILSIIRSTGAINFLKGLLDIGVNSTTQGKLVIWDGAGGNTPAYIKMHSPNGTAHYLFVEDDGTWKTHTSAPTQNSDGSEIGAQT